MILALRTDKPDAEIYLLDAKHKIIDQIIWTAHKQLSVELVSKIEQLLKANNTKLNDLTQVVFYQGPGSFTGLRIGATVVNSIAYAQNVVVLGLNGEDWLQKIKKMDEVGYSRPVVPAYGSEANITKPKK